MTDPYSEICTIIQHAHDATDIAIRRHHFIASVLAEFEGKSATGVIAKIERALNERDSSQKWSIARMHYTRRWAIYPGGHEFANHRDPDGSLGVIRVQQFQEMDACNGLHAEYLNSLRLRFLREERAEEAAKIACEIQARMHKWSDLFSGLTVDESQVRNELLRPLLTPR